MLVRLSQVKRRFTFICRFALLVTELSQREVCKRRDANEISERNHYFVDCVVVDAELQIATHAKEVEEAIN